MGLSRKAVVDAVKEFLGGVASFVGGVLGLNRAIGLRFEIATSANGGGLVYVDVPQGTKVWLDSPSPLTPVQYQGSIGAGGSVTFLDIPRGILFYARLGEFGALSSGDVVIDLPSEYEWDSAGNNFYREIVEAQNSAPGHPPVHGFFLTNELVGNPVTFRVRGYPVHARFTYSFLNSQPAFHGDPATGDPGTVETIMNVPIPAGIKVSLNRELPLGLSQPLVEGRTRTDTLSNGITETVWNTVLYQPLDPLPNFISDIKPLPTSLAIHVAMEMKNDALGLGPINVHGLPYFMDRLDRHPLDLPLIEVRGQTVDIYFDSTVSIPLSFGTSFGMIQTPFDLDINENSIQVGIPPEPPAPLPPFSVNPLGHLAIFQLQAITDAHYWFWLLSANAGGKDRYVGFEMDLFLWHTPWGALDTVSWPRQIIPRPTLFLEEKHWDVHSVVAHEFAHQISYGLGIRFGGSSGMGIFDALDALRELPIHTPEKYTSVDVAILEAWAEFVEAIFGRYNMRRIEQYWKLIPPNNPAGRPPDWTDLWDKPGAGVMIEGCVSRAFFQAYIATHQINLYPQFIVTMWRVTDPANPGNERVHALAFNDSNGNGIQDPGEPGLRNVFLEFIGVNQFVSTDSTGEAIWYAPVTQVTGVRLAPAVVVPAALTHTSQLDTHQDWLKPLDYTGATAEIFSELFYKCWLDVEKAEDVYFKMLKNAHVWGGAHGSTIYETLRTIFWNNNMALPRVQDRTDPVLGRVFQLEDWLSHPILGAFQAHVMQSTNPADLLAWEGDIWGPFVSDTTFPTGGQIDVSTLAIDPLLTRAVIVEINVRSVIPDANLARRDVWVRGVFRPQV